ncbi:MAG: 3-deoxy-D-manno-octulosonic acid transferase [Bacteroidia bacterium]
MKYLYNFSIYAYIALLQLAALFHAKAKLWVNGRKNWQEKLKKSPILRTNEPTIWFHCASLGEFEQGRNLIEKIKADYPQYRILLTFFSPSGYEIRKNYAFADEVLYLPADTPSNARIFLELVQPKCAFFIKYEIWLNYLEALHRQKIPTFLVAARLRENSRFFHPLMKKLYQQAFASFTEIFTQDEITKQLLLHFSANIKATLSSDTRYDRVFANRLEFQPITAIEVFTKDKICIICGSSWQTEEDMMLDIFEQLPENVVVIFAPHEIHPDKITKQIERYARISFQYSNLKVNAQEEAPNSLKDKRILWIDNVGMLSKLYYYADISFVGGGFRNALHNILEPATFGNVVLFGFQHQKFPEATELMKEGGAFEIKTQNDLVGILLNLVKNQELRETLSKKNRSFVEKRIGATAQILTATKKQFVDDK